MNTIEQIIHYARSNGCSDIHLTATLPPVFRKNGQISVSDLPFDYGTIKEGICSMMTPAQRSRIDSMEDVDFCHTTQDGLRQRVNVYRQQGQLSAAIRILNDTIPTFEALGLPLPLRQLTQQAHGLVLITGPTGSGKSTTLAAMIDAINRSRNQHIITLEDPIEYVHSHKGCIVHQREVGRDVPSFASALRSALREDPDVILVGEMRDLETISAAVTAAETGHLVLSTLHTTGAVNTIDRIIDVFPQGNKDQIRTQLAGVLRGVVTQQLLPLADGTGRCGAFEILLSNDAVTTLIRENRCHQIPTILQTNAKAGMCSLNADLAKLVTTGRVSLDDALEKSPNRDDLFRLIQN